MNLVQFHTLRTAVQGNASPGRGRALERVARDLRDALVGSGLFEDVEVGPTDDPDRLVSSLCRFRALCSEDEVATLLEQAWASRVGYPFWEAHVVWTGTGQVEFQAASRVGVGGHYVTVHLVAERARFPAQRTAIA